MYALLNVAFALLAGLLMTRIFSRWRLPDVTAFLVAGVLIGPFCLGRLGITGVGFATYEDVAALGAISDVAMGFIAFAIGNAVDDRFLRRSPVRLIQRGAERLHHRHRAGARRHRAGGSRPARLPFPAP